MVKLLMVAGLLGFLSGCSNPPPREINRFQAPPPEGSELAAQLDAIPGMRRQPSGHYAGLEEIVVEYFPIGSNERLLVAFLNREGFSAPIPPSPLIGGFRPQIRASGRESRIAEDEVRARMNAGTSLTGTTFITGCRNGGKSTYKVTWRATNELIAEIFTDSLKCIIDL